MSMESDLVNEEFHSPQPISVIATGPALIDSCLAAVLEGARKGKNLRLCRLYKFRELVVEPGVELDVSEGETHQKAASNTIFGSGRNCSHSSCKNYP